VKQVEVARKYGFSVSNFRRWFVKFGRPVIPHQPTDADCARARSWRKGKTLAKAWAMYREFASEGPWADNAELPVFDDMGEQRDEDEELRLNTRPDARVVLVCEKMHVQRLLEERAGRADPVSPTRRRQRWRGFRRSHHDGQRTHCTRTRSPSAPDSPSSATSTRKLSIRLPPFVPAAARPCCEESARLCRLPGWGSTAGGSNGSAEA
jgi:hypothetical protein